jgi:hypothetical protein
MTLADDLEQRWRTMEAGGEKDALTRTLMDLGVRGRRMMLSIDGGCRELLFPARRDFEPRNLPSARGLRVAVRTNGTGSSVERFLVLRCTRVDFRGVFRSFGAAIIEQVSNSDDPAAAALDAMRVWQEMFNRAGSKTEAMLSGLFAELHELVRMVDYGPHVIDFWTGPQARPQDFINGVRALEAKATRALANEVEINGLEQLWSKPYEKLVLVVKQIVADAAGLRLHDVIDALLERGVSSESLYERLDAYGFATDEIASIDARFTHRGSRYFLVTPDSPVLSPDLLVGPQPVGVSRVRYRASLDRFKQLSPSEVDGFLQRLCER